MGRESAVRALHELLPQPTGPDESPACMPRLAKTTGVEKCDISDEAAIIINGDWINSIKSSQRINIIIEIIITTELSRKYPHLSLTPAAIDESSSGHGDSAYLQPHMAPAEPEKTSLEHSPIRKTKTDYSAIMNAPEKSKQRQN